jgi:hypothetical protein
MLDAGLKRGSIVDDFIPLFEGISMNPKLGKMRAVAALLVMAATTGQPGAAHPLHKTTQPQQSRPADLAPLYDALAFADEALDVQAPSNRYSARLYPIERSGNAGGAAASVLQSAPPARSDGFAKRDELSAEAVLPEPGNWAMVLAGLLGVGAIARRRMPV